MERLIRQRTAYNIIISALAFIFIVVPLLFYFPYKIHNFRPLLLSIHIGKLRYSGLIFIISGTLAILWCYSLFITFGKGTPFHAIPPDKLIIKGLYKFVRNPMLASAMLVLMGEAILFESTGVVIYMIAGFFIWQLILIFFEEPQLRRRFGDSYTRYCREVPRWIPRLTPYNQNH